jgi:4a-hydroxytetrahydrobiopterin dehydratase
MSDSRLTDSDIDARLANGWLRVDGSLQKAFEFPDFHHTMAFVNALAWIAHREDHSPDLAVHYGLCVVRYTTHSAGGITERDFVCTAMIDSLSA